MGQAGLSGRDAGRAQGEKGVKRASAQAVCPCGGTHRSAPAVPQPRSYPQCCGRYIEGGLQQAAPDAESLMRSRYTAYVLEQEAYLLATWHASRRPADCVTDAGTRWLGLEVRDVQAQDTTHAEVEFVARMRHPGGQASRLHERSRFVREDDGRWYYVDGDLR